MTITYNNGYFTAQDESKVLYEGREYPSEKFVMNYLIEKEIRQWGMIHVRVDEHQIEYELDNEEYFMDRDDYILGDRKCLRKAYKGIDQ